MKALRGHATERSQIPALVFAKQTMGVILNDCYAIPLSRPQNRVHLTGDAGVMNYDNCSSMRRNETFQLTLIKIKSVRSDVSKNRAGATQDESVNRRDECERRYNNLVPRLNVEQ
jgi:hypothetical protein